MPELTAKTFCDSFLKSYDKARAAFTNDRWIHAWRFEWNALMLWQPTETFRPPPEIQKSVLAETAFELGLSYRNGEPLRLDAVFSSQQEQTWFPMLVAIEHENDCRGFESEVTKLLSVRCPLKVGITYTYTSSERRQKYLEDIQQVIGEAFAKISSAVGEDQKTEYLFLVGAEVHEREKELSWYALSFRGSEGPQNQIFQPATQI